MQERMMAFARFLTGRIRAAGGDCYIAGGFVRDHVMGVSSKDLDMVVFDLVPDFLPGILRACPGVSSYKVKGASFEVYGVLTEDAGEVELAFPRRERKTGVGHGGFDVDVDPFMSPVEESLRRDVTMNAMYMDPVTGDILDFHGGLAHVAHRRLVPTSMAFGEDPLRPLRLMSMASRFALVVDRSAREHCLAVSSEFDTLPKERLWTEWRKWALGKVPSMGLRVLEDTGWIGLFPTLEGMAGLVQDSVWHPEGDAWTHTVLAVDAASAIADRDGLDEDSRLVLVLAALCHDLGKPMTTVVHPDGRVTSNGHDRIGMDVACDFLNQIGTPAGIARKVVLMTGAHMAFAQEAGPRALRRLSRKLFPVTIADLARLVEADHDARPPRAGGLPETAALCVARANDAGVSSGPLSDPVMGRDILPFLGKIGLGPGPVVGRIAAMARVAQDDGVIPAKSGPLEWLASLFDGVVDADGLLDKLGKNGEDKENA